MIIGHKVGRWASFNSPLGNHSMSKSSEPTCEYFLWNPPANSIPESSGYGIQILPGFGPWVLLHPTCVKIPPDAIPVSEIVTYLNTRKPADE